VYASFKPFLSRKEKEIFAIKGISRILYLPFIIPGAIINFMFRAKDIFTSQKNHGKNGI
jgi:capsule polysaccharide export protein KpsE/RkpR